MICRYDIIALILLLFTICVCGIYIVKLRKQFKEHDQIHDRFSEYFKKN